MLRYTVLNNYKFFSLRHKEDFDFVYTPCSPTPPPPVTPEKNHAKPEVCISTELSLAEEYQEDNGSNPAHQHG